MKKMTTRPRLLLLDACVVIDAYKLGVWEKLVEQTEITVPSTVAYDEAKFYSRKHSSIPEPIDLPQLESEGKISIVEVDVSDLSRTIAKFDVVFAESVDEGELEALALIDNDIINDHHFCSTDGPAIQALAMLGHSEHGISFEAVLEAHGLRKRLPGKCTEDFFQHHTKIGQVNRITGAGLRK